MFRAAQWILLSALAVACIAGPAVALTPEVRDSAGYFRPETVQLADEQLQDIQRTFHKDVLIETVKTVPADKTRAVSAMTSEARKQFFAAWAEERAHEEGLEDGIYVLICKNPPDTQVVVGPRTEKNVFPPDAQQQLAHDLRHRFLRRHYDTELLEALQFVRATLDTNLNAEPATASPRWSPLVVSAVIGGLLLLWVVIALLRAALTLWEEDHPEAAAAHGLAVPRYHDGVLGALLGGMVGAQAGHWLYTWALTPRRRPAPVTLVPAVTLPAHSSSVGQETLPYPAPGDREELRENLEETRPYPEPPNFDDRLT